MHWARVVTGSVVLTARKAVLLTAQLHVCIASVSADVAHGSDGNMCSLVWCCDSLCESDSGLVGAAWSLFCGGGPRMQNVRPVYIALWCEAASLWVYGKFKENVRRFSFKLYRWLVK